MKTLKSLAFLLSITTPFATLAYNETGEALPSYSYHNNSSDYSAHWWVNFGLGAGSSFRTGETEDVSGASAQISFNGALSPSSMLTIYSNAISHDENNDVVDAGVMLGLIKRQPNWYASAAAGLCYYKIETTQDNDLWFRNYHSTSHGVGIPFQAQAFWTPFKHFGVGVIGHVVASKDPYANALLAIQIYG